MTRPKLKLVEFYHHRGDADVENVDTGTDADNGDVSDALDERRKGETDESNESDGTDESEGDESGDSGGSWLRRLAGVALLGGVAFALARRRQEAKATIENVRDDDTTSRLRENDRADDLASRDPVSRLREADDAETGIDATTEPRADVDPDDAVTTGVDVESVDPENGQEDVAADDVGDAEGVGSGALDAIDGEDENETGATGGEDEADTTGDDTAARTDVDREAQAETDVGLAPKADVEGESDVGHDEPETDDGDADTHDGDTGNEDDDPTNDDGDSTANDDSEE